MKKDESPRRARRRERLAELISEVGSASKLATETGTPKSHISAMQSGARGLGDVLAEKLERHYGKNPGWFDMTGATITAPMGFITSSASQEIAHADEASLVRVPLLENSGEMGEGSTMLDGDVIAGQLTLNPSWVSSTLHPSRHDALRFIHSYGDSMTPTFNSGDVLLVDTGINEVRIDGVYVLNAHDRLFIKRVRQRLDGVFEISSDNPTHKTVDELNGNHAVQVLGRVIWVWNGRRT